MTLSSPRSRDTGTASGRARRRPAIRPLPAAALCAAAAFAVAGCGSVSSSGSTSAHNPHTAVAEAKQALELAASQSTKITSFTATMNVSASTGIKWSGTAPFRMTGTVAERTKPLLVSENLTALSTTGQTVPTGAMRVVLTGQAIYLKLGALAPNPHKPWAKLSLSSLNHASGVNVGQVLHQLEGTNPLTEARLFPFATNVHKVGTATVDGVPATMYTGTYHPLQALSKLAPSIRKLTGPALSSAGVTTIRFTVWIDSSHTIRKIVEHAAGSTGNFTSVVTVTSINQPLHIELPPASQVALLPGM
jgi:hypothetical protein